LSAGSGLTVFDAEVGSSIDVFSQSTCILAMYISHDAAHAFDGAVVMTSMTRQSTILASSLALNKATCIRTGPKQQTHIAPIMFTGFCVRYGEPGGLQSQFRCQGC
jgi:hypothetical protein